jgi:hypothetical protein
VDDDWSAGHPPDADVVVVHTPTFQVNENTAVTRHRKWRWWTSNLTVRTDQNPVSLNIVHRLLVIDCADERVDPFQKRPTKTPFRFRLTCLPRVTRSTSRDFPCPEPAARVLPEISSSPEGAAATDYTTHYSILPRGGVHGWYLLRVGGSRCLRLFLSQFRA